MSEAPSEQPRKIGLGVHPEVRKKVLASAHRIAQNSTTPISLQDTLVEARHDTAVQIKTERLQEEVQREKEQGELDFLTGLLNRKGLERSMRQVIQRAKRTNQQPAIIAIDANNLKAINDQQGHEAGDEYLKKVARELRQDSRIDDIFARVGGDEFVIIQRDQNEEGINAWWNRIGPALTANGISLSAGASFMDLDNPQKSLAQADQAMYSVKEESRTKGNMFKLQTQTEMAA